MNILRKLMLVKMKTVQTYNRKNEYFALLLSILNIITMPVQAMAIYFLFFSIEDGQSPDLESMSGSVLLTNILYILTWLVGIFYVYKTFFNARRNRRPATISIVSLIILLVSLLNFSEIVWSGIINK